MCCSKSKSQRRAERYERRIDRKVAKYSRRCGGAFMPPTFCNPPTLLRPAGWPAPRESTSVVQEEVQPPSYGAVTQSAAPTSARQGEKSDNMAEEVYDLVRKLNETMISAPVSVIEKPGSRSLLSTIFGGKKYEAIINTHVQSVLNASNSVARKDHGVISKIVTASEISFETRQQGFCMLSPLAGHRGRGEDLYLVTRRL